MSALSLFLEMLVIFILISIGFILYRTGKIADGGMKTMSFLVVNFCNPAIILNAAMQNEEPIAPALMGNAVLVTVLIYAILIGISYLLPLLLRIPKKNRFAYQMLTVYGNVGYIGFPVCAAVLGQDALLYVSINCLVYNVLFYTYGEALLARAAGVKEGGRGIGGIINAGTVSSLLTLLLYLVKIPVPMVLSDTVGYLSDACVFLSMLVLGCSIAQKPLKFLITGSKTMWVFLVLRMLVIPAAIVLVLKPFVHNELLLGTIAIMVSLPGGNLPLMVAEQDGLETSELSRGIVLTTIACIVTIPLIASLLL